MPVCSKTVLHLILKHEFLGNLTQTIKWRPCFGKSYKLSVYNFFYILVIIFVISTEQISNSTFSIYQRLVYFTPAYNLRKVISKERKNLENRENSFPLFTLYIWKIFLILVNFTAKNSKC